MMGQAVDIEGVTFMALFHHDGRFVRGGGLIALARRDPDGGHTILHYEPAESISRVAGPGHRRWANAVTQGMNEILVHLAGSPRRSSDGVAGPPVRWALHPDDIEADERLAG